MFFTVSKIFELIGSPSHLALMILALGVGLAYTRYFNGGRRLTTLAAALLLLMAFGPVGHMMAVPLEARFAAPPDDIDGWATLTLKRGGGPRPLNPVHAAAARAPRSKADVLYRIEDF